MQDGSFCFLKVALQIDYLYISLYINRGGGGLRKPDYSKSPQGWIILVPLRPETFGFVRSLGLFNSNDSRF